ncbi:hypothetical protein [Nonomuraea dietziae]|uniref:hypothetical protein n=1 Tax=Nonomuraea dietziae TaxID=65515 RepID=UPI0033E49E57
MREHSDTTRDLLTPEMTELAARVICAVREEGPGATARILTDLPANTRLLLTITLAALVPDDRALEIGVPTLRLPAPERDPLADIQRVMDARLALEQMPQRITRSYTEPITPYQAAVNRATLSRALDEHERDQARRNVA